MGNKLCKKKGDLVDGPGTHPNRQRSFKGIISNWNLKPRWKSDSHLNKQRQDVEQNNAKNNQLNSSNDRPISKSSDWTEVPLVAATDADNDVVYVKNAQLSLIFNDNHTPTPPPRKHHKKPVGLREKIKAVAKQGLQAVQSSNSNQANRKPVEEPICIKKIVNYNCPHCDAVSGTCHRHRAQEASQAKSQAKQSSAAPTVSKSAWDRKASTTSTSSLPTQYGEGKLSIAIDDLEDIDGIRSSVQSLPGDNSSMDITPRSIRTSSIDNSSTTNNYMSRARSFGSLLPQLLLHKLSTTKAPLAEIESDDSFGGLEDWDVGLIEHYNPKDASLPRGVKSTGARKGDNEVLAGIEDMIVTENEISPKPQAPIRKTESLLKKITRGNSATSNSSRPTDELILTANSDSGCHLLDRSISVTPPPSPEKIMVDPFKSSIHQNNLSQDHSTLLKIIEDYQNDPTAPDTRTIDLYRNLSTEEACVKGISKTTQNIDTIRHTDVTVKTYTIKDDLSKFDSPNIDEFMSKKTTVNTNPFYDTKPAQNPFVQTKNIISVNDFLNAERQFITETDPPKFGKLVQT